MVRRELTTIICANLSAFEPCCGTQTLLFVSGLINQQYTLISAIVFARAFGAELVLPAAMHRNSFSDTSNGMVWRTAPFASVWDEDHLIRYWAEQGLTLHKARSVHPPHTCCVTLHASCLQVMAMQHSAWAQHEACLR